MGDMQNRMERLEGHANENGGVRHKADQREFNMSKVEKPRLQVSNIMIIMLLWFQIKKNYNDKCKP